VAGLSKCGLNTTKAVAVALGFGFRHELSHPAYTSGLKGLEMGAALEASFA